MNVKTKDYEGSDRRGFSINWIQTIVGAALTLWLAGATAWAYNVQNTIAKVTTLETKVGSMDINLNIIRRVMERLEDRVIYNERSLKNSAK